jgi:hypothetical protein
MCAVKEKWNHLSAHLTQGLHPKTARTSPVSSYNHVCPFTPDALLATRCLKCAVECPTTSRYIVLFVPISSANTHWSISWLRPCWGPKGRLIALCTTIASATDVSKHDSLLRQDSTWNLNSATNSNKRRQDLGKESSLCWNTPVRKTNVNQV